MTMTKSRRERSRTSGHRIGDAWIRPPNNARTAILDNEVLSCILLVDGSDGQVDE